MSTEHQKYSTQNQSQAIVEYAREHGLTIVRRYADEGKSGLNFEGRPGLQRLISDVQSGASDFGTVLIYDVSRWGRFQNSDEAAYYEFICKRAGLEVRYCAESFENDGGMLATLVKSIKRLMAAEYSRELSAKVFAAKCTLIRLGFRQGGAAGYGLRRLVIDENRNPKCLLRPGEGKAVHTDRILLVPGPSHEKQVLREIFKLFVTEGMSQSEIVRSLNRRGLRNEMGHPWHRRNVREILTNEKYVGNNVWNRVSFKLKQARVKNPRHEWVRADHAFEPIIDTSAFYAAQRIIAAKSKRLSKEDMLARLRSCLRRHRRLTADIIDADEEAPCKVTYQNRFGSLRRAYELVGYSLGEPRSRSYDVSKKRLPRRKALLEAAMEMVRKAGGDVDRRKGGIGSFVVDGCVSVMTKVVTIRPDLTPPLGWDLRVGSASPDIFVAARMNRRSGAFLDYYLLPRWAIKNRAYVRLASTTGARLEAYRSVSLAPLPRLISRMKAEASKKALQSAARIGAQRGRPKQPG